MRPVLSSLLPREGAVVLLEELAVFGRDVGTQALQRLTEVLELRALLAVGARLHPRPLAALRPLHVRRVLAPVERLQRGLLRHSALALLVLQLLREGVQLLGRHSQIVQVLLVHLARGDLVLQLANHVRWRLQLLLVLAPAGACAVTLGEVGAVAVLAIPPARIRRAALAATTAAATTPAARLPTARLAALSRRLPLALARSTALPLAWPLALSLALPFSFALSLPLAFALTRRLPVAGLLARALSALARLAVALPLPRSLSGALSASLPRSAPRTRSLLRPLAPRSPLLPSLSLSALPSRGPAGAATAAALS